MKKSGLIFTSIAAILLSTSVLADENKFYIKANAGVGLAQVKEKISRTFGDSITRTDSIKNANNIAYQATLGVSAAVLPVVNAELSYSWKDFAKQN